jgi:hypothetical protein
VKITEAERRTLGLLLDGRWHRLGHHDPGEDPPPVNANVTCALWNLGLVKITDPVKRHGIRWGRITAAGRAAAVELAIMIPDRKPLDHLDRSSLVRLRATWAAHLESVERAASGLKSGLIEIDRLLVEERKA